MDKTPTNGYEVFLDTETQFLLSTSGSQSSIEKHNQALQALGIDLVYFTFGRPIAAERYANLLRAPIIRGGAVTGQGLKSEIIPFLDEVDRLAKATGAVNTVVNENGELHGYSTDSFGFENALRQHIEKAGLKIETAIIYGNGGVSGVAAHVLRSMVIATTMTGRDQKKVTAKMQDLNLNSFKGPYDLVINATPVSSERLESAVGLLQILKGAKVVFDHNMPEKDGKTNYLQAYCDANDVYFIPGKDMYTGQLTKQWGLFLNGYVDGNGKAWRVTEEDIKKYWAL